MQSDPAQLVDLRTARPPAEWGVTVDDAAVQALADRWQGDEFVRPAFDYPGTPAIRDETWWFDFATFAVSVLACLWPPEGDEMWSTEFEGSDLDDAPGIFAVFTRAMTSTDTGARGISAQRFASITDAEGMALFAGTGTLQLIPERVSLLREVGAALIERWDGTALNLVDEAQRDGRRIAALLTETVPGFFDRAQTEHGTLPFDKLAHLCAAIMAAGVGWDRAGFHNFDDFPVYPDYMLPRVLRHVGILSYAADLAELIDQRQLIEAGSDHELGLRWATVFAGAELRRALNERGAAVSAPALDYRLWSEAVLGPDAATFGEHHRTITMRY